VIRVTGETRDDARVAGLHRTGGATQRHDAARTAAFPAKTAGKGGVPLAPTILADGTKEWELTASVFQWETEPGKLVEAWGYNGMVPGPELRAEIGDRVRIVLHNELPAPTTIHFHGMLIPNAMDGVPVISQPAPFSKGETVVAQQSSIKINQEPGAIIQVPPSPQLADVVRALNALGATPGDLLAILQAIKAAGALNAELEVI